MRVRISEPVVVLACLAALSLPARGKDPVEGPTAAPPAVAQAEAAAPSETAAKPAGPAEAAPDAEAKRGAEASPAAEAADESSESKASGSTETKHEPRPAGEARGVRELGVAPSAALGGVKIDHARRPAWVESAPQRVGELHTNSVSSGPWLAPDEARRALDEKLVEATRHYVEERIPHQRIDLLLPQYDLSYIKSRLLRPENVYEEQIEGELSGSSYQIHALLEFDGGFRGELDSRWQAIVRRMRLALTGVAGGGVLLGIAVLFGLLRADTATRGYYTRTLQFVGAVAILGLVAAGVLLAKSIPWL